MGQKSGRNGAPAPQSRVSLSESKPEAEFCLLECVRSFLLGDFLRIRSRPFSLAVRSRAILCARLAGAASHASVLSRRPGDKNFCAPLRENCADVFATSTDGAGEGPGQDQVARSDGLPGEARGVHSRVHANPEETELRVAQSGARAADEFGGSNDVYSRHRSQPAGTLDRAGARRPREGSAGRALSHRARHAGRRGSREPQAGAIEIWSQEAEGGAEVRAKEFRSELKRPTKRFEGASETHATQRNHQPEGPGDRSGVRQRPGGEVHLLDDVGREEIDGAARVSRGHGPGG